MSWNRVLILAVSMAFLHPGKGQEARFTLGFDGCPDGLVEGLPGEVKPIEVYSTLTTAENNSTAGAQGWSLSIEIVGANLKSITVEGIVVDAILNLDDDCDPTTPAIHYDHYPVDLADSWLNIAAKASGEPPSPLNDPSRKGAISAVMPDPVYGCGRNPATLQPNGTERILKFVIEAAIPQDDSEREVILRYVDGMRTAVSQPVKNVVTFGGASHRPEVQECRFTVRKWPGFPMGFGFGFEGCPASPLEGPMGETKTFEIFPTLTTYGDLGSGGPESWAISIGITGGTIRAIDLKGITVSTAFDHDGDPGTPPLDPYPFDIGEAWRWDAELATYDDDPSIKGAISMVILSGSGSMILRPNTTQRIARLLVEAVVPETDTPREVVLRFEDGFRSTGLPRENWINIGEVYASPALGECRFSLQHEIYGMRVPGDSGQNGLLEISDAVLLFSLLFGDISMHFPCGNGWPTDRGNVFLLDWQPDGAIDISDGIALLQFLFLGGPRHHLAVPGNELEGCVPVYACTTRKVCR